MGNSQARTEFTWDDEDEPHQARRKAILAKYPQIKDLNGPDMRLLPCVLFSVALQLAAAIYIRDKPWPYFIAMAWIVGGTISHSLSLACHELSHGLCFESMFANELLGMIANCAQAIPSSITFRKYHLEHHQKQGYDFFDVDIPTSLEGVVFNSLLGKLFFVFMQPFFYALRPMFVYPKPPCAKTILNYAIVIAFDIAFAFYFGGAALGYLLLSDWLGLGLHPISGHFIAEHYEFVKGQETYSYYGPLNYLTYNVGYHNEHHDFPRVSGFNLPKVREIAKEFYQDLPQYSSWAMVLFNYITDPSVGPFSRVKRFPLTEQGKQAAAQSTAKAS